MCPLLGVSAQGGSTVYLSLGGLVILYVGVEWGKGLAPSSTYEPAIDCWRALHVQTQNLFSCTDHGRKQSGEPSWILRSITRMWQRPMKSWLLPGAYEPLRFNRAHKLMVITQHFPYSSKFRVSTLLGYPRMYWAVVPQLFWRLIDNTGLKLKCMLFKKFDLVH